MMVSVEVSVGTSQSKRRRNRKRARLGRSSICALLGGESRARMQGMHLPARTVLSIRRVTSRFPTVNWGNRLASAVTA